VFAAYDGLATTAAAHPDCAAALEVVAGGGNGKQDEYPQLKLPECPINTRSLARVERIVCSLKELLPEFSRSYAGRI